MNNCWSHPGSYFGALAIQTVSGVRLEIEAGSAMAGFAQVKLNGHNLLSSTAAAAARSSDITLHSTHTLTVTVGNYNLSLENSDGFVNLASVSVLDWNRLVSIDQPHGLLGQTWKPATRLSSKSQHAAALPATEVIEGTVDDYLVRSDDLFGTDFLYNKFDVAHQ
jgi:hypothetical protein